MKTGTTDASSTARATILTCMYQSVYRTEETADINQRPVAPPSVV
jgi:hypothetical protein